MNESARKLVGTDLLGSISPMSTVSGKTKMSIYFYSLKLESCKFVCVISGGNPHIWPILNRIGPVEAKKVFLVILFPFHNVLGIACATLDPLESLDPWMSRTPGPLAPGPPLDTISCPVGRC